MPACWRSRQPYDVLVQVMDAVRQAKPEGAAVARQSARRRLFPDVSIGDAPVSVATEGRP